MKRLLLTASVLALPGALLAPTSATAADVVPSPLYICSGNSPCAPLVAGAYSQLNTLPPEFWTSCWSTGACPVVGEASTVASGALSTYASTVPDPYVDPDQTGCTDGACRTDLYAWVPTGSASHYSFGVGAVTNGWFSEDRTALSAYGQQALTPVPVATGAGMAAELSNGTLTMSPVLAASPYGGSSLVWIGPRLSVGPDGIALYTVTYDVGRGYETGFLTMDDQGVSASGTLLHGVAGSSGVNAYEAVLGSDGHTVIGVQGERTFQLPTYYPSSQDPTHTVPPDSPPVPTSSTTTVTTSKVV